MGRDAVFGGAGNDTVDGGDGFDYLRGEDGNDRFEGVDGNDVIIGYDGRADAGLAQSDQLFGGIGDDTLAGDDGDSMTGGAGADEFSLSLSPSDDPVRILDFVPGTDRPLIQDDILSQNSELTLSAGSDNSVLLAVGGKLCVILQGTNLADVTSADIVINGNA